MKYHIWKQIWLIQPTHSNVTSDAIHYIWGKISTGGWIQHPLGIHPSVTSHLMKYQCMGAPQPISNWSIKACDDATPLSSSSTGPISLCNASVESLKLTILLCKIYDNSFPMAVSWHCRRQLNLVVPCISSIGSGPFNIYTSEKITFYVSSSYYYVTKHSMN